jgi:hypothetical protein
MSNNQRIQITPERHAALKAYCKARGITMTRCVERLIVEAIKAQAAKTTEPTP